MRRERESPKEFGSKENSRFAHDRCEHETTHYDSQCSHMPRSTMREMKEEEIPRRETLTNYLQEYESQTKKFRDHITFQEFFKIKVERSKQHDMSRFFISNFYVSPTCSTITWVEE